MRVFAVRFENRFSVHLGTLKVGVALSQLGQLPQLVQSLGDKAYGENWGRATVRGTNVTVLNQTSKAEKLG
jgi:hypothetical protein